MNSYSITDGEIVISFDGIPSSDTRSLIKSVQFRWDPVSKSWRAPHSAEREELAAKLTGTPPETGVPVVKDTALDAGIVRCLSAGDDREAVEEAIIETIAGDPDRAAAAVRDYRAVELAADARRKELQSRVKVEADAAVAERKAAAAKREVLEDLLARYLLETGEDVLRGDRYRISLKESVTYGISGNLENEIRRRAALPPWITMDLKVDQAALKKASSLPEGVVMDVTHTAVTWTEREGDPNRDSYAYTLDCFLAGCSIRDIADRRGLSWKTVFKHLRRAMREGRLDIRSYVDDSLLSAVGAVLSDPATADCTPQRCMEIVHEYSYDKVVLAMSYLSRDRD